MEEQNEKRNMLSSELKKSNMVLIQDAMRLELPEELVDEAVFLYENIRNTLITSRKKIYSTINTAMVNEYWDVGRQITEAIGERAGYGKQLLRLLSDNLTNEFGKGYDESNLRKMRQFYSLQVMTVWPRRRGRGTFGGCRVLNYHSAFLKENKG